MESGNLRGSSRPLPVSVLTGFLGSGKTTVLNHLVQQPALSRTLVLIDESALRDTLGMFTDATVRGPEFQPVASGDSDIATSEVRP